MKLIRLREVISITGLSRSTIYKKISEEEFPKSVFLGSRAVAWVETEILDWVKEKIEERDG
jgi:prophage regulatory protein